MMLLCIGEYRCVIKSFRGLCQVSYGVGQGNTNCGTLYELIIRHVRDMFRSGHLFQRLFVSQGVTLSPVRKMPSINVDVVCGDSTSLKPIPSMNVNRGSDICSRGRNASGG